MAGAGLLQAHGQDRKNQADNHTASRKRAPYTERERSIEFCDSKIETIYKVYGAWMRLLSERPEGAIESSPLLLCSHGPASGPDPGLPLLLAASGTPPDFFTSYK